MRSGSDMGIHVVVALIILSLWELKVQATNKALNRPPSCYILLSPIAIFFFFFAFSFDHVSLLHEVQSHSREFNKTHVECFG